jgi:cytochrome c-type biogenesis protein CcmH
MFWVIIAGMAVVALALVLLPTMKAGLKKETLVIIALLAAIPLAAVVGYEIGASSPAPLPAPLAAGAPATASAPDPVKMVAQLETRLKNGSGTPEEWAMLGRSYVTLNRHQEAASAYAKATETITNDAQLYADYADALAMSRGGLDKDSEALIDNALKVDSMNPKALSLKATVAYNKKDYQGAIALWDKLLTVPGLGQDWLSGTRANIEEARSLISSGGQRSPVAEAAAKDALKVQSDTQ